MTTLLLAVLAVGVPGDEGWSDAFPAEMRWEEPGLGLEGFLRFRAGAWISYGFEFEATRADTVQVKASGQAMASGGLDLGVVIAEQFVFFVSGDYSGTDDSNAQAAGAAIGWRDWSAPDASAGVPDEVMIYAGAFWAQFEIEEPGFGDFDDAIGFRAGLAVSYLLSPGVSVSAIGEYRLVEFDYEEEVIDGDKHAGGSGAWVGMSFDLRF